MATKKKNQSTSPAPKGLKLKVTKKGPQKKCATGSFRFIEPEGRKNVRIVLCCPPGKWNPKGKVKNRFGRTVQGKCAVSLKVHARKHYGRK